MTYTVYYKKTNSIFWTKLKKVKGDGMIDETSGFLSQVPNTQIASFNQRTHNTGRWFILADETRVEIPSDNMIFRFSKERHYLIKDNMQKESGQKF